MLARIALIPVFLLLAAGCSKNTPVDPTGAAAPSVLQVTPPNGATAVRLDASVTLDFGVTVDTDTVENGFRLISEADMTGSCPDPTMPMHGSMDAVMADSALMAHMDAYHSLRGSFAWNEPRSVCTFTPDSLMRPQTRHMIHLGRTMLEMMDRRGGSMGSGPMTGSGDMVPHFTTTTADDHSGHH